MKKEIKFRGLRIDGKGWVYGDLNQHPIHYACQIIENGVILHSVDPETVGQFTGLKDKKGAEIYEGDIVEYNLTHDSNGTVYTRELKWHNHAWRLNGVWLLTEINYIEITGNIHQQPTTI